MPANKTRSSSYIPQMPTISIRIMIEDNMILVSFIYNLGESQINVLRCRSLEFCLTLGSIVFCQL